MIQCKLDHECFAAGSVQSVAIGTVSGTGDVRLPIEKAIRKSVGWFESLKRLDKCVMRCISTCDIYLLHKDTSLAVCVRPLSFVRTDMSLRMIEWLDLLRQQGYSKAIVYVHSVHENIRKVIKHVI